MKALEFKGQVSAEGIISLPEHIRWKLPPGTRVRVLILVPEDIAEEEAWERLTLEEFFSGYSETDSVYDRLPEDVSTR